MTSDDRQLQASFRFLPLTLHIETLGGLATPLVLRGTPLPATRSNVFSTADDNQTTVEIHVLIGESPLAAKNQSLGKFRLTGIPNATRGGPQITVTYTVDKFCHLTATASMPKADLEVSADLSDVQPFIAPLAIERALTKAEADKEADQQRVREIEARTQAESAIAAAELRLKEVQSSGTVGSMDGRISQRVAELGLAMDSGIIERIHAATQALKAATGGFDSATIGSFFPELSSFFGASSFSPRPAQKSRTGVKGKRDAIPTAPATHPRQKPTQPSAGRTLGRIFGGGDYALDASLCFILMPFTEASQPIYEDHIKKVIADLGLSVQRADEIASTNLITWDIWERINKARFIIADMTGRNPNVFYEVGLAHAISKEVILLTRNMGDIPFDLQSLRFIVYDYTPRGMIEFEKKLRAAVSAVMQAS